MHSNLRRQLNLLYMYYFEGQYSFKPLIRSKIIFVHIPKTAGVSINQSLFGNLGGGHTTITEYEKIFPRSIFDSCFKFSVVRNPWDRALSAYRFLKKGGFNRRDQEWACRNLSNYQTFEKFVKKGLKEENISSSLHFRPQVNFILSDNNQGCPLDYIGFYENLTEVFSTITKKATQPKKILHENSSGKIIDYRKYYDHDMIKEIESTYEKDIAILGYKF